jgi:hypothetical protein
MFRTLLLFPIFISLIGGSAVIDQSHSPSDLKQNKPTVQSVVKVRVLRPDLKVHIDTFDSPGLPNSCLGRPTLVGYITVSNAGDRTCSHPKLPTAFGYSQISGGNGVLFQVTSVGPVAIKLAPGGQIHMIVQSVGSQTQICNAQKAISEGYVEIKEPACRRETNVGNNKATVGESVISNPD